MTEEWKDIPEFSPYQVSDLGNVRDPRKNRILPLSLDKVRGYYRVYLNSNQKRGIREVHRITALSFFGEPMIDMNGTTYFVNHKNGIKTDNRLVNLEYVTSHENTQHYHSFVRPMLLDKIGERIGYKKWRFAESAIIRGDVVLIRVDGEKIPTKREKYALMDKETKIHIQEFSDPDRALAFRDGFGYSFRRHYVVVDEFGEEVNQETGETK